MTQKEGAQRRVRVDRSEVMLSLELPRLLAARGLSGSQLARLAGVSQSHVSHAMRAGEEGRVSGDTATRIATALGLPHDWFPETRKAWVVARLDHDPALVDRIYDEFRR
jgi:transcriptional regulator with XRE-family HTH domain